jgi:hypothetical protein
MYCKSLGRKESREYCKLKNEIVKENLRNREGSYKFYTIFNSVAHNNKGVRSIKKIMQTTDILTYLLAKGFQSSTPCSGLKALIG